MYKRQVLNRYFDALSSGGANLPDGSDSPYERSTETPPHSSDTRGTSVERLNGTKVIRAMNEDGRCTMILCTDNGQVINRMKLVIFLLALVRSVMMKLVVS